MKKEKCNKQKNLKQGFTLLELLIVVIIIAILAAIALPQYQMAVGRSKLATIKTITKNVQEAAQRYYMINGSYTNILKNNLDITIPSGIDCYIWEAANTDQLYCRKDIFKVSIRYYVFRNTGKPKQCLVFSTNTSDKANRLCQKETGKTASQSRCESNYCYYLFN